MIIFPGTGGEPSDKGFAKILTACIMISLNFCLIMMDIAVIYELFYNPLPGVMILFCIAITLFFTFITVGSIALTASYIKGF